MKHDADPGSGTLLYKFPPLIAMLVMVYDKLDDYSFLSLELFVDTLGGGRRQFVSCYINKRHLGGVGGAGVYKQSVQQKMIH